MQPTAKLNYLRTAPRKVRMVADMIRGKDVETARTLLRFSLKKSIGPMEKLLNSAIANAKNDFDLDEKDLVISKITVDEGPKLKRWRPRSRGRAMPIQKKTSHITIVLSTVKPSVDAKIDAKGKGKRKKGISEPTKTSAKVVKEATKVVKK